jgi:hypothetical protein
MATGDEIAQAFHPMNIGDKKWRKKLNKSDVIKSVCVCSRNAEHTEKEIKENECANCKRKIEQTVL